MKHTAEEVRASAQAKLAAMPHSQQARAFLASPAGAELAKALRREFVEGDLVGDSELETYFNLGAREVVLYLLRHGQLNERTGETP